MSQPFDYRDIFVPGGYPKHTYYARTSLNLENKISEVTHNLCKLVVVTGHTKSGKTTLVQKILPRDKAIWIDGGGVRDEDDFWTSIIDQLELFQNLTSEDAAEQASETGIEGSVEVGGNIVLLKSNTKIGTSSTESTKSVLSSSRQVSSRIIALRGLEKSPRPLVIDDFHYVPRPIQGNIVRALKPRIFQGLPVIIIAIPHRRYDSVKVEKEMTGRILPVDIPLWGKSELENIPTAGFSLLEKEVSSSTIGLLAAEAIGSPHLMQEFCRTMCQLNSFSDPKQDRVFTESAETIGRPIFEKLAQGPRQRSDRKIRILKTGEQVDIYGLVLHSLSHIKPDLVTLEYEHLRTAIKEICRPEDIPNIQQISLVLKQMSRIASTDESSSPVIDFNEEDRQLHITDPFFAFYLRWGDLSR